MRIEWHPSTLHCLHHSEAGLASLEERVAPGYLYDTLSRLERLYEDDPPAADRLLEELIDFLRRALAPMKIPIPTQENS